MNIAKLLSAIEKFFKQTNENYTELLKFVKWLCTLLIIPGVLIFISYSLKHTIDESQKKSSKTIADSQIKSAKNTAEDDRQVKNMEIIYKEIMNAKNDKKRIKRSLNLLLIHDPEMALEIANSISEEENLKDVSISIINKSLDNFIRRFYFNDPDLMKKDI